MSPFEAAAQRLLEVLRAQPLAALATLHRGEPAVSMVPVAVWAEAGEMVIHVSRLATHTADLLAHPRCSWLVLAPPADGVMPQATARIAFHGHAQAVSAEDPQHAAARAVYLARFADAAPMFEFGDFTLMRLQPAGARVVGGFAQAMSLPADAVGAALRRF